MEQAGNSEPGLREIAIAPSFRQEPNRLWRQGEARKEEMDQKHREPKQNLPPARTVRRHPAEIAVSLCKRRRNKPGNSEPGLREDSDCPVLSAGTEPPVAAERSS